MIRTPPSSSAKTDDAEQSLVPRMRFPEFRGDPAWRTTTLGDACEVLNNRRRPITSDARQAGSYPYYGASGIVDFVHDFIFDERLVLVGEDGAKWGAFENTAFIADGKYWVNNHAHVLRPHSVNEAILVAYLTMIDMAPFVTGAAPPKLTLGKLKVIPIPIPPSRQEQNKIADCLTSLDEVIAAQARKVEALKTHKKGLMQSLFPQEGQTVPRFRFPEFCNGPEWKQHTFGEICRFVRGPFGGALKKDIFVSEGFAVYEQSHAIDNQMREFRYFITKEKYEEMKRFAVRPGDIIMSCSGTMGRFAQLPSTPVPGVINQALLKLTVQAKANAEFILLMLGRPAAQAKLLTQSAGGAIKNVVGVPQLKEIGLTLPDPVEQKWIAEILGSLEAAIAAEADKLAAVRTHKTGLLQQLLPSPEEVYH